MPLNTGSSTSAAPAAEASRPTIGVIGLGIMGGLYARHMLEAGFAVWGFDVSAQRMQDFRQAGGHVA